MMSSGACQFAKRVTTQPAMIGLRIDPIWPVVFMDALRIAVCSPPTSMHVAQLALSVNMDAATATAMSDAATAAFRRRRTRTWRLPRLRSRRPRRATSHAESEAAGHPIGDCAAAEIAENAQEQGEAGEQAQRFLLETALLGEVGREPCHHEVRAVAVREVGEAENQTLGDAASARQTPRPVCRATPMRRSDSISSASAALTAG